MRERKGEGRRRKKKSKGRGGKVEEEEMNEGRGTRNVFLEQKKYMKKNQNKLVHRNRKNGTLALFLTGVPVGT